MHEFRATTQNFSPAIIGLDAAMRASRLRHAGNPVLAWWRTDVAICIRRRFGLTRN
jgi:hypothetical protein